MTSPCRIEVTYNTEQSFSDPSEAVCSEETAVVTLGDCFAQVPPSILDKNEPKPGIRYDLYVSTMDPQIIAEQLQEIDRGAIEADVARIMVRQGHEVVTHLERSTPPDQTAERNEIAALRVQLDAIESEHPELKEPFVAQSGNLFSAQNGTAEKQLASGNTALAPSTNPLPVMNEVFSDNRTIPSPTSAEVIETARQRADGLAPLGGAEQDLSPLEALQLAIISAPVAAPTAEPAETAPLLLAENGKSGRYWYPEFSGNDELILFLNNCLQDPKCRELLQEIQRLMEGPRKQHEERPNEPPLIVCQETPLGHQNAEPSLADPTSTTVTTGAILQGALAHSRVTLAQAAPLPVIAEAKTHRQVERPRASSQGSSDRGRDNSKNGGGRERERRDDESSEPKLPA